MEAAVKRGNNVAMQFMGLLISLGIISFLVVYSPNNFTSDQGYGNVDIQNPLQVEEKCDIFEGKWIQTGKNESLYKSTNCAWISDWKNCFKQGRKDVEFVNWRWKPHACQLPRFAVNNFFKIVRNRRMMFIGDSVARNQMESLLCILSEEESPTEVEKEDEAGNWTLYFSSYNFTITFIRSVFLVKSEEIMINGSSSGTFNIDLDKVDDKWTEKLPSTDYAIISAAHWFFRKNYLYEEGNLIGCVHCSEPNVTNLGLGFAVGKAIRSALEFIHGCKNCNSLMTILRTFSPTHFEKGNWNSGGYCNKTRPVSDTEVDLGGFELELRNVQKTEVERAQKKVSKSETDQKLWILDVTMAMLMRPDGHPGIYCGNPWTKGINDCLHWCLPGPIDIWNDWLIALMKMQTRSSLEL
ncbi:Xyloglucan O-acetyltransferase 3 [Heracleum sosnowskyi]|uniref:Xyloglucan O-acetyltransferase 3 n=1 Tax=Heracleum sosnowskyi TaxID=360622 RepID=A0AAD8MDK0_9APIA|nr:Xyloglucan O-acetyltransferase 3 [Heracleum sosnowskyi]